MATSRVLNVVSRLRDTRHDSRAGHPAWRRYSSLTNIFLRILVHNHEHMGQAIGYVRMNGIAPPWSAGRDQ